MQDARIGFQAIYLPQFKSVLVIGGFNGVKSLASVEMLDIAGNKWQSLSPMSYARQDFGVILCPSQRFLYAIGGLRAIMVSGNLEYMRVQ